MLLSVPNSCVRSSSPGLGNPKSSRCLPDLKAVCGADRDITNSISRYPDSTKPIDDANGLEFRKHEERDAHLPALCPASARRGRRGGPDRQPWKVQLSVPFQLPESPGRAPPVTSHPSTLRTGTERPVDFTSTRQRPGSGLGTGVVSPRAFNHPNPSSLTQVLSGPGPSVPNSNNGFTMYTEHMVERRPEKYEAERRRNSAAGAAPPEPQGPAALAPHLGVIRRRRRAGA